MQRNTRLCPQIEQQERGNFEALQATALARAI
jgi:hypothetical protein